jgi:thiamine transporter
MAKNNTRKLVTSAMLVALATILSIFPKFNGIWPNGGSITFCSMLPIVMVSYFYGRKWGLMASSAFAVIQMLSDLRGIAGMDLKTTFAVILLDYVIAFVVLGLGGLFRGKFDNIAKELSLGCIVAIALRFLTHFISGYLLFSSYAEWFFTQEGFAFGNKIFASLGNGTPLYLLYSFMYNGSYLIPEMIITSIVAYIIGKQKFFINFVKETGKN